MGASPSYTAEEEVAADDPSIFNFDKVMERFVEGQAQKNKEEVSWWDMHGKHEHLKEYAHKYNKYKVTVTAGNVKYGEATKSTMRPNVVYTQWVHNGQPSTAQKVTVKRTTERTKKAVWNIESGFSSSFSVSISAKLPSDANFQACYQTSLDLKSGRGEEITETETFSVDEVVTVPPMKSVKIEWAITDVVQC